MGGPSKKGYFCGVALVVDIAWIGVIEPAIESAQLPNYRPSTVH